MRHICEQAAAQREADEARIEELSTALQDEPVRQHELERLRDWGCGEVAEASVRCALVTNMTN